MLHRLRPKPCYSFLTCVSYRLLFPISFGNTNPINPLRFFSSSDNHNKDGSLPNQWNFSGENEGKFKFSFSEEAGIGDDLSGLADCPEPADQSSAENPGQRLDAGGHDRSMSDPFQTWNLEEDDKDESLFDIPEIKSDAHEAAEVSVQTESSELQNLIEKEKELTAIVKGPNRTFGDLMAASGITDSMLDSLIALKDFEGIEGLPSLGEIEEMQYEKSTRKSVRAEIELQKQEEVAKARVREIDEKGRAYGTGRRKCSVARVWVQPGEGKFLVNDKEFDVYFPMLEHRAALLRPFLETKTLGLWNVTCTVKGGGVSGQVGAIRLGISNALQNWEPDLRPALKTAGLLTRDARVVERKKPGRAKARKSFQWVKR